MKNKYCKRSRISEAKFREIIKYFSLDLEAKKISILTGGSEQTLTKYLYKIRVISLFYFTNLEATNPLSKASCLDKNNRRYFRAVPRAG